MPKRLLRSIIDFGDGKISREMLNSNYNALSQSTLEWVNPDERKIFDFIKEYTQDNLEPPSAVTIRAVFERRNDITVLDKLDDVKALPDVRHSTNFTFLLKELVEVQTQNRFRALLTEVEEISTKGKIFKKGMTSTTIKGTVDAIQYFNRKIYEILPPDRNMRTEADVRDGAGKAFDEYCHVKANPAQAYGRLTGLQCVDNICHGIKPGELWTHAAAPGQLKTTFAANWGYHLMTKYKSNVLYVNMEMKAHHTEAIIRAMHTSNEIFQGRGLKSLDYRKIRDGELLPEEEEFYKEAMQDLHTNPNYCRYKIWSPDRDVTVADIRVYAEILHKTMEVGMIVLDHGELIKPSKSYKDRTVELNHTIREVKNLALHFDNGNGIPVCMLYQINRAGQEAVEKKRGTDEEGMYSMFHLSYSNEVEKSSDYITTTYTNVEMKRLGEAWLCNMKNRDNPLFEKTKIRVDFASHRLFHWDPQDQVDIGANDLTQDEIMGELG